jgi:hypothetical protein
MICEPFHEFGITIDARMGTSSIRVDNIIYVGDVALSYNGFSFYKIDFHLPTRIRNEIKTRRTRKISQGEKESYTF